MGRGWDFNKIVPPWGLVVGMDGFLIILCEGRFRMVCIIKKDTF